MKKVKIMLLHLAEAPFAAIVHLAGFIDKFTNKPILYNVSELAFRMYNSLSDAEARILCYKNFSDMMNDVLRRIAVDDSDDHDDYAEDTEYNNCSNLRDKVDQLDNGDFFNY